MEVWKDIPNYDGMYQVSNQGRVKSLERIVKSVNRHGEYLRVQKSKILKPMLCGQKHSLRLKVHLYKDNKMNNSYIHQLVAMAFLGHKKCGLEIVVDHMDNDPLNNNVNNLQLITSRENLSKDKKDKTSRYTGVHWNKDRDKWVASIGLYGERIYLGLFNCEHIAAEAYKKELEKYEAKKV